MFDMNLCYGYEADYSDYLADVMEDIFVAMQAFENDDREDDWGHFDESCICVVSDEPIEMPF